MKAYKLISFFCGCGGLDLGFRGGFSFNGKAYRSLPFRIMHAYDSDQKCVETYKENVAPSASVKDLSSFDVAEMPRADVLIGGFPCQDFAICGSRKGLRSKRGRLYKAQVKYMTFFRPKLVVAENVAGLASVDNGKSLKKILRDFEGCGYKFETWNFFAPHYGVPQARNRIVLVGVRDDIKGFPKPPKKTHIENFRSTEWAIKDLERVTDESVPNQSQYFKAAKAENGHGQGDEKSRRDGPAYTIRANAKSRVQFHYSLKRRLTVRECARLQTFPDSFNFPHAATTNIMQIGNAVPPVLAHKVASSMSRFLEGAR